MQAFIVENEAGAHIIVLDRESIPVKGTRVDFWLVAYKESSPVWKSGNWMEDKTFVRVASAGDRP